MHRMSNVRGTKKTDANARHQEIHLFFSGGWVRLCRNYKTPLKHPSPVAVFDDETLQAHGVYLVSTNASTLFGPYLQKMLEG